jgi:hypothetical protein
VAEVSPRNTNPWIAFLAGAVAVLAVVLIALAWWRSAHLAENLTASLRATPDLPSLPHMPEGPKLPNPPIPQPK